VISLDVLERALDGEAVLPERAALLTFDDGFVDHYRTVCPMLRSRGVSGVFFVAEDTCGSSPRLLGVHKVQFLLAHMGATAFGRAVVERGRLSSERRGVAASREVFGADRWEQADDRRIKEVLHYELPFDEADALLDDLFAEYIGDASEFARDLYVSDAMVAEMAAAGMTFGYHTRTHRMLSRLGPRDQERELSAGVTWIRGLTGQSRVPFCYPWGGPNTYTADTLRILADAGYSSAFNTVRRTVDLVRDGRFELPRLDTRDLPPYTQSVEEAVTAASRRT
jgi:peptidoglycan/xylan/chitin deacetylase (PgdA/CDA1 family)